MIERARGKKLPQHPFVTRQHSLACGWRTCNQIKRKCGTVTGNIFHSINHRLITGNHKHCIQLCLHSFIHHYNLNKLCVNKLNMIGGTWLNLCACLLESWRDQTCYQDRQKLPICCTLCWWWPHASFGELHTSSAPETHLRLQVCDPVSVAYVVKLEECHCFCCFCLKQQAVDVSKKIKCCSTKNYKLVEH